MKFLLIVLGLAILGHSQSLTTAPHPVHPEAEFPFVEYCSYFNYPVETHYITTDDGYILTFYRIQKKNTTIRRLGLTPIYLQHGLTDSSDTWIVNDEDKAPGLILANKGFDVWIGNSRGNKHSRNHTTLNPDKDKEFWMFTFQHMADYDLPAAFRYISGQTQQKINYIGHSQGTMIMHIALAKNNPIVEGLLDKYFGFGPVAFCDHQTSRLMTLLDHSPLLQWYESHKIYEFLPSLDWFETTAGVVFCAAFEEFCSDLIKNICDADPTLDNADRFDVIFGHEPSGTSVLNMAHWKQLVDSGKWGAFDYGSAAENRAHYGQDKPPAYDPSNIFAYSEKIRVPLRWFAGNEDELADKTDVNRFWPLLNPQAQGSLKFYTAGHVTFIWGLDTSPWMNDVLSHFQNMEIEQ